MLGGLLPNPRLLQPRNAPFWLMGMSKGFSRLEFIDGAQKLPLFIALILDALERVHFSGRCSLTLVVSFPTLDTCVPSLLSRIYGGFA